MFFIFSHKRAGQEKQPNVQGNQPVAGPWSGGLEGKRLPYFLGRPRGVL